MEKYYEDDNFLYLVVEVIDLHFGFDLSTVNDYEIAVKIVTQSYSALALMAKMLMPSLLDGKFRVYYLHGLRIQIAGFNL